MVKRCTKCGQTLDLALFPRDISKVDGVYSSCKACNAAQRREFYNLNRVRLISENVERQRKNKEQSRLRKLKYSRSPRGKEVQRLYRATHTPKPLTQAQKDRARVRNRKYRLKNREKINAKARLVPKRHVSPEKRKLYKTAYYNRVMSTPEKKLIMYTRIKLNSMINGRLWESKDLPFTGKQLRAHIESLWVPGMSWENHSKTGWHIDHIKPVSLFNLGNPVEFYECWSLDNLRPLWAKDNLIKGKKYNQTQNDKQ